MSMDTPAGEEPQTQGSAAAAPDLGEALDLDTELAFDSGELADESKPDSVEFTPPEPVAEKPQPAEADLAELDSGELGLYMTPINLDPEKPAIPFTHPSFFSIYLSIYLFIRVAFHLYFHLLQYSSNEQKQNYPSPRLQPG